jgi:hypothetical protein
MSCNIKDNKYIINNLIIDDKEKDNEVNDIIKSNNKQILSFEFDIQSEEAIFIKLLTSLKNGYRIMKADERFCNVDFCIIEEKTLKILYVEYKKRKINMKTKDYNNKLKYNTFFIDKTKLNKIYENYYNEKNLNTIIIYDCIDDIYFSLFNKDMLNSYLDVYNNRYELNKSYFNNGYDNMINFIKNYLKPNKTF